jgi:hypothetical protein
LLKQILASAAAAATIGGGVLAAVPAQASALKADACSLSVGASHPKDYTFHYKTTTPSVTVETGTRGSDTYSRYISGATPGYRVSVSGKVTAVPKGYKTGATCSTSFTPAK